MTHNRRGIVREDVERGLKIACDVAPCTGKSDDRFLFGGAEIDIERVLRELTRIGLSDIRKVFAADGSILPPAQWDAGTAAAISSIEVSERQTGNGEQGAPIVERTYKVKYWDKNTALDKIAKHFGMFIDRSEVTVTHRLAGLSDDELMTEIRRTLAGHERRTAH